MSQQSGNYVFTYRPDVPDEVAFLADLRGLVREANAGLREIKAEERLAIVQSPIRGKGNPNDWKYDNRFARGKRIRIEDAERVHVYVVETRAKRGSRRRAKSSKAKGRS